VLTYYPDFGVVIAMRFNANRTSIEEHFDAATEIAIGNSGPTESGIERTH
jgi:hypothetical protein